MSAQHLTIPVRIISTSQLALLVTDGNTQSWVPRSVITAQHPHQQPLRGGITSTHTITLPATVATDKGLAPQPADTRTADLFGDQA